MSRKYGQGLVPYAFRIEPEIKEQLAKMPNANEFIRDAIREKLTREDRKNFEEYCLRMARFGPNCDIRPDNSEAPQ